MAGPLAGLRGVAPQSATVPVPEGTAATTHGGSADPRHANTTINDIYPWQGVPSPGAQFFHSPYGIDEEILGMPMAVMPAGAPGQDPRADMTPVKGHAAPGPPPGRGAPRPGAPPGGRVTARTGTWATPRRTCSSSPTSTRPTPVRRAR